VLGENPMMQMMDGLPEEAKAEMINLSIYPKKAA
jgi:hypothetical protein